jgi:NAD-dependent deacetylase
MLLAGTSGFVYPAAGFPHMVKRSGGSVVEVSLYETDLSYLCDVILRGKSGELLPLLVDQIKAKRS